MQSFSGEHKCFVREHKAQTITIYISNTIFLQAVTKFHTMGNANALPLNAFERLL